MADIAEQLQSEIHSLEEHIRRTQERFLATRWLAELLPLLQRAESQLEDDEVTSALDIMRQAKARFGVNGELAAEIEGLAKRRGGPLADDGSTEDESYDEAILPPARDPGDTADTTAHGLFEEEDDEDAAEGPSGSEDKPGTEEEATGPPPELWDDASPVIAEAPTSVPLEHADVGPSVDDGDMDGLFDDVAEAQNQLPPAGDARTDQEIPAGDMDGLFDDVEEADSRPSAGDGQRQPKAPTPGMPRTPAETVSSVNILSDMVGLDDLQAALDIAVPSQDLSLLENRLRAKLSDKVVASLRESQLAAGQYILIPRVVRFAQGGSVVPCTVRNLAKAYHRLFGDLRDLRPYVNDALLKTETPEMGWALITAEAPRESLSKNYMEQNQYMRYLVTSLGIPSHMIRRRTLVEAIYDMIVGQLVLGKSLQHGTLDWTASSPSKNDFICAYRAEEGIRVRALSRTSSHASLGVCPNW
ncbi:hypothetical protein ACFL6X_00520 [Candidatus Latescibacterota bacterium]